MRLSVQGTVRRVDAQIAPASLELFGDRRIHPFPEVRAERSDITRTRTVSAVPRIALEQARFHVPVVNFALTGSSRTSMLAQHQGGRAELVDADENSARSGTVTPGETPCSSIAVVGRFCRRVGARADQTGIDHATRQPARS